MSEPTDPPPVNPEETPAWRSYLVPGTNVLRNLGELTDPAAVAIFERIVSTQAEADLRQDLDRPKTFDLAHLNGLHERLFADVYPFAGQLRIVDTAKPGQTGEPFLHHRWIETYTAAVAEQLHAENNLSTLTNPGQWADRAAYYQAALLHAHPYREGNGRSSRLFVEDLAAEAGHTLDWTRSSSDRNNLVAVAAGHGDYEPMRAVLTAVAGGTVGVDRDVEALDDLDKLLHGQAWARTGMVFGTDQERTTLVPQLEELGTRIDAVRAHLALQPDHLSTTEQPAEHRWRGLVSSVLPALVEADNWPTFAAELDQGAAAGVDVARELPRLAIRDPEAPTTRPDPAAPSTATPRATDTPTPPPPGELAAAAGYYRPPSSGPRI